MKETDKAVIQFLGYRVSEISYTCPVTLEFPSDAKLYPVVTFMLYCIYRKMLSKI